MTRNVKLPSGTALAAVLGRSFVEMKTLNEEPDMSKLYTEAFLPREMTK